MQRIERMQVTNHERWGKLVKTWSTGKNYLDDDNDYPMPDDHGRVQGATRQGTGIHDGAGSLQAQSRS